MHLFALKHNTTAMATVNCRQLAIDVWQIDADD